MPTTLTVRDETLTPGGEDHVFELEFQTESITVRELMRERVYQEVDDYNRQVRAAKPLSRYHGLVQPSQAERGLNAERPVRSKEIDWRKQYDLAIEAYEHRRLLILVRDHQTESLDETLQLQPGAEVTFLRLVPLVGG